MGVKNGDQKRKRGNKTPKPNNKTRKNMKEEGRTEESQMFNNALVAAKIKLMAQDNVSFRTKIQ